MSFYFTSINLHSMGSTYLSSMRSNKESVFVKPTQIKVSKFTNGNNGGRNKNWHVPFSAAIGGGIGAYTCFPFEALKKKMQSGQLISYNPRELFRGSTSFAVSVIVSSVTAMTFRYGLQNIPGYDHASTAGEATSAIASGVLGAFVGSTPVENIILTQQLNKVNPYTAVKILLNQGIMRPWVGLPQLALREAGFAGTMLWGGKAARIAVYNRTKSQKCAIAAEIGAGIIGAVLTHPFDTMATIRQQHDGAMSSLNAARFIYKNGGYKAFWKGGLWRVGLFAGRAFLIPRVQEHVHGLLNKCDKP